MKKKIALILALVIIAVPFTACGGGSSSAPAPAAAPSSAAAPAESQAQAAPAAPVGEKVSLQLSHQMAASHSIHETALKFAELAGQKSGGSIDIQVFEAATLGTERENLEALTAGTLDLAVIAVEFYPSYVPEVGVLVLPYLYDSYDHCYNSLKSDAGKKAAELILAKTDVKVLSYYVLAFRQIFSRNAPINTVSDLAGLKIRVPESPVYVNTFSLLGASPTPVAWGETYTALDTGVVDGLENTPESISSASMNEVTKYMNLSDHITAPTTFSVSNKVFQKLSAEQQQILMEAADEAGMFGFELTQTNDTIFREKLAESLEIVEVDKDSFRNAIDYDTFDVMKYDEAKAIKEMVDAGR